MRLLRVLWRFNEATPAEQTATVVCALLFAVFALIVLALSL